VEQRDRLNLAIVAANNHYVGFGPGTANMFRKMFDLSEVTWNDVKVPQTEGVFHDTKHCIIQLTNYMKPLDLLY
jgi:hypothetical protein